MSNVVSIHDRAEKAWLEYTAAAKLAQETLDFEHGMAAGRAWRRFLDVYMSADQRSDVNRAVTPCR